MKCVIILELISTNENSFENLTVLRVVRSLIKEPTTEITDHLINNLCQTLLVCIKL